MKPTVVFKFGSSLLLDTGSVKPVAAHIAVRVKEGERPVVVVSAVRGTTDYLLSLARALSERERGRELDMLLTAGERVSMALLALALKEAGVEAVSFTGSQIGLITDGDHSAARIVDIRPFRLEEALAAGKVPVVAGFQGVSTDKEVTTLGRGGSDVTAVALSAKLGSVPCVLYKGAGGVHSVNPDNGRGRVVPCLSYDEALELSRGSAVVSGRAVALASRFGVELAVRGLDNGAMTHITEAVEGGAVKAVTVSSARLVDNPDPAACDIMLGEKGIAREEGEGEPLDAVSLVGSGAFTDREAKRAALACCEESGLSPVAVVVSAAALDIYVRAGGGEGLAKALGERLGLAGR